MIFKGIKRKSNQIFFNKQVQNFRINSQMNSSKNIKKVIILLDDASIKATIEKELITLLNISEKDVEIIIFNKIVDKSNSNKNIFTPEDFGWYGKLKSDTLKSILTKKYDLLINYSKVENLYNNLLILQSKSAFNIGYAHLNKSFYDLLIDCNPSNYKLFNIEIKKYLKILNKI